MADLVELARDISPTVAEYWDNSYLAELTSRVLRSVLDEKRYWYIVLDRTIFHPKGGGQPSDKGSLEGEGFKLEVRKSMLARNGVIIHWGKLLDGTPGEGPAMARLDWDWRFLMMRRHSAAHLLDYCLESVVGSRVETLDSWLGERPYVAYKGESPTPPQLSEVQALENRLIANGAAVLKEEAGVNELKTRFADSPNFARLPNLENLRVITIEGCSPIPCGGTHLRNISEAKGVRLQGSEQQDDGFRLYFDVV